MEVPNGYKLELILCDKFGNKFRALTTSEAAHALGCSESNLRLLVNTRKLNLRAVTSWAKNNLYLEKDIDQIKYYYKDKI